MPRATKRKAVAAVATERANKRSRDSGDDSQTLAKRPRVEKKEPYAFRFLDLPGELRNRIYEIAFDISSRTWPVASFQKEQKGRSRRRARFRSKSSPFADRPIPFSGFVNSCTLIRSEFRAWWLGAHSIPLCALDRYLSAFYPRAPRTTQDRKRFDSFFDAAGTLRVYVRKADLGYRDLLRLVRHKVRFPRFTIGFDYLAGGELSKVTWLFEKLVNHTHPAWSQWIRSNSVSQILVLNIRKVRIVVKEKAAPLWMRPVGYKNLTNGYLTSLGLDGLDEMIDFAVDYS
ncbi:hypothetical protein K458DRAFT_338323 [Lentithecium fluviatile CBS 122367]|uniref:F-box domain-containing protein n=1 Tax=Lentithecium fluviatile CBS 122367 TaxID=1168545 RepID=A0A6G1J1C2_9PLEO|nr:hypothetical protein K458DRAFT_338323 [Lentithecium fluviatile CBS 122367]